MAIGRKMILRTAKELRWLHFNFPYQDNAQGEGDKLCNAIHLYTGDAIKVLEEITPEKDTELVTGDEQINPCPFCGGAAKIIHSPGTDIFAIGCDDDILCPGHVYKCAPVYYGKETALKAWNGRK